MGKQHGIVGDRNHIQGCRLERLYTGERAQTICDRGTRNADGKIPADLTAEGAAVDRRATREFGSDLGDRVKRPAVCPSSETNGNTIDDGSTANLTGSLGVFFDRRPERKEQRRSVGAASWVLPMQTAETRTPKLY